MVNGSSVSKVVITVHIFLADIFTESKNRHKTLCIYKTVILKTFYGAMKEGLP
jgi:hypothetical protein